jgi:hypothetical protein
MAYTFYFDKSSGAQELRDCFVAVTLVVFRNTRLTPRRPGARMEGRFLNSKERANRGGCAMRRHLMASTLLLIAGVAFAANAHFIGSPTVSQQNRQLKVCGSVAGLGNENVTVVVSATATTTCTNKGGNPPPGQKETVSGTVSDLKPENGRVNFCVTTNAPANPCPDGMRPESTFSNISVKIYQGGKLVLSQTF